MSPGDAASGEQAPLRRVCDPRSIAVVGASADPTKRGHQILRGLGAAGYRGRIYPVNPKGGSLLGHQVFPSIASLPEPVDLAVLCTPARAAPDLVAECGRRGVGGAIVLAVGFRESGPEGAELERRLVEAARVHGVRVLGPNTSGMANFWTGANLIGVRGVRPGGLGLLVQSGNMALALMNEATDRTWEGISLCIGLGNEADVGFAETLDYLAGHEETRGVIVYVEGFRDGRAFLRAAARLSPRKPIVVVKAARSDLGAASARSHTGAVAGAYARLSAGMAQAGVCEVLRTDEALHVAVTLTHQPPLRGPTGLVILSDGGGQGTLAADALSELGAPLAELSSATRMELRALLGPAAAVENPVDLAGAADADPTVFADALDRVTDDDAVGGVLVVGLFGGYAIRFSESLSPLEEDAGRRMAERATTRGVALVVHSMYAARRGPALDALGRAGVPVIGSLDVACRSVAALVERGARLDRNPWPAPSAPAVEGPLEDRAGAADAGERPPATVFAAARAEGRTVLTEVEARELLSRHGVRFAPALVATDPETAARAVASLDAVAVLKVVSGRIVHKSEAGGVALDLRSGDDARRAFESVMASAGAFLARRGFDPEPPMALLTPMAPPPRLELLIGAYRDPDVGPVLTVGHGGLWVEAYGDVATAVSPVDAEEIERMLARLSVAPILAGGRGAPPLDRASVVKVGLAVLGCLETHVEISEIEINPLFVYPTSVEPIDARVLLSR